MRPLLVLLLSLLIAGCTKPIDTPLPTDLGQFDSLKPALEKLSPEERELFGEYFARHLFASSFAAVRGGKADPIPEGMTIGKAIAEQRSFRAAQEARMEEQRRKEAAAAAAEKKAEEERKALQDKMTAAVSIHVTQVSVEPEEINGIKIRDNFRIQSQLQNKSDKAIVGVKWIVTFKDSFGDPIQSGRMKSEKPIAPGESVGADHSVHLNQFSAEDQRLAEFDMSKGKIDCTVEAVLFSDGTKLELPTH